MTTKMAAAVQAVDVEILHDLGMLDFRDVSSDFARILRSEFTDDV